MASSMKSPGLRPRASPDAPRLAAQVDAPFLLRALGERTPEQLLAAAAPVAELTCVCVSQRAFLSASHR
jgi:hypothetical protein